MNVVPLALTAEMMDQRIDFAEYVKVLQGTHKFPTGSFPVRSTIFVFASCGMKSMGSL